MNEPPVAVNHTEALPSKAEEKSSRKYRQLASQSLDISKTSQARNLQVGGNSSYLTSNFADTYCLSQFNPNQEDLYPTYDFFGNCCNGNPISCSVTGNNGYDSADVVTSDTVQKLSLQYNSTQLGTFIIKVECNCRPGMGDLDQTITLTVGDIDCYQSILIAPIFVQASINQQNTPTIITNYFDTNPFTTNLLKCCPRTCTTSSIPASTNFHVSWNEGDHILTVVPLNQYLGSGQYTETLTCSINNYPGGPTVDSIIVITVDHVACSGSQLIAGTDIAAAFGFIATPPITVKIFVPWLNDQVNIDQGISLTSSICGKQSVEISEVFPSNFGTKPPFITTSIDATSGQSVMQFATTDALMAGQHDIQLTYQLDVYPGVTLITLPFKFVFYELLVPIPQGSKTYQVSSPTLYIPITSFQVVPIPNQPLVTTNSASLANGQVLPSFIVFSQTGSDSTSSLKFAVDTVNNLFVGTYQLQVTTKFITGVQTLDQTQTLTLQVTPSINKGFCLTTQYLDAMINEQIYLELPVLDAESSYIITSNQTFQSTITGNLLKVLSKSEQDVGTSSLQVTQKTQALSCKFAVKVTFKSKNTNQNVNSTQEEAIESDIQQRNATNTTDKQQDALIDAVKCTENDAGEISCVNPANGFSFFYDAVSMKLIRGSRNHTTTESNDTKIISPTLKFSKVNGKGQLDLKFSKPMNLMAFLNTTTSSALKSRLLKSQNASDALEYLYLLSSKHLRITLNQSSSVDPSLMKFHWNATNITSDTIKIQIIFENPLLISSESGQPDLLVIELLPPSFKYFTSLETHQLVEDALRNETQIVPTQVKLDQAIQNLEKVAYYTQVTSQSVEAANIAVQVILSGTFNQMWIMQNALQIAISFQEMNLPMPGNVNLVMVYISNLASFNIFPTQEIIDYFFKFSETESPGFGFESVGVTNKSLILYLGPTFIIMQLVLFSYVFYSFVCIFSKYDKLFKWLQSKLKQYFIWGQFYTFLIQSYFDFAVGIMLLFEQPKFETISDYYDFSLACVFTLVLISLPIISVLILWKNETILDQKEFKVKYGSFYDGFATNNQTKRKNCFFVTSWFLVRRLLQAVNLAQIRHQTMWLQLTFNVWLCLADAALKLHWDSYESKLNGLMQKMNDAVVLLLSVFIFLFSDLTNQLEDKYFIGWIYLGIIAYLVFSNISVMFFLAFGDMVQAIKRKLFIRLRNKILARNKAAQLKRDIENIDVACAEREKKLRRKENKLRAIEKGKQKEIDDERSNQKSNLEQLSEIIEEPSEESGSSVALRSRNNSIVSSYSGMNWLIKSVPQSFRQIEATQGIFIPNVPSLQSLLQVQTVDIKLKHNLSFLSQNAVQRSRLQDINTHNSIFKVLYQGKSAFEILEAEREQDRRFNAALASLDTIPEPKPQWMIEWMAEFLRRNPDDPRN